MNKDDSINNNQAEQNEEKSVTLECSICLCPPKLPVATQCGHIFCWSCLNSWLSSQKYMVCPICKNGIQRERITKLFVDNSDSDPNVVDDRPKAEHVNPVINNQRPNIFSSFLNSLGVNGVSRNENEQLRPPDEREVKRNRLSLIMLIMSIFLIVYIFNMTPTLDKK